MRSKKTLVAGVVVSNLQNPLSSEAVVDIEEELTQFLANSRYDRTGEENILKEFTPRRVDGIIAGILSRHALSAQSGPSRYRAGDSACGQYNMSGRYHRKSYEKALADAGISVART